MGRFVDSVIAIRILKLLTTPFEKTKAYELGIIDDKGKELKKMRDLRSVTERDAYTVLHRLVYRLKKIIERVPIENKKLLSYAAALALVKENFELQHEPIELESMFLDRVSDDLQEEIKLVESFLNNENTLTFRQFIDEDIPANNAGGGGIAGFTPDTLGVPPKAQRKYQKMNQKDQANLISQTNGFGT
tara:strand:- start:72 stop:638 length:567 start_codon:yes stop_codon:yes gene_type:complete